MNFIGDVLLTALGVSVGILMGISLLWLIGFKMTFDITYQGWKRR